MKRLLVVLAALTVVGGIAMLSVGLAQGEALPEHPHLLVLGLEFEGEEVVGFRKCLELAAGQALPLNSQHAHVHFGTAGFALFDKAGHAVVPAAPFPDVPWSNCQELIDFFFPS